MSSDRELQEFFGVLLLFWFGAVFALVSLAIPLRILWAFTTAHGGIQDALRAAAGSIGF